MHIIVLGASGMLGNLVAEVFSHQPGWQVRVTARTASQVAELTAKHPSVEGAVLDAEQCTEAELETVIGSAQWVINAIGIIKPYIHDDNPVEVERATRVNALFPHLLARVAEKKSARVLQIATDCVYAGTKGGYLETDAHDPLDVYGKTKSLGEVYSPNVTHIRCSIIGPEIKAHVSLLDWFRFQPADAKVNGFTNHFWNGVTTLHFAHLCRGIIAHNLSLPHSQHIIPGDQVSKAEMLTYFAEAYQRSDVTITPLPAKIGIDRTLATHNPTLNREIWQAAGYAEPPTIKQMTLALAAFERQA